LGVKNIFKTKGRPILNMELNSPITGTFIWTYDEVNARQEALTSKPSSSKYESVISNIISVVIIAAVLLYLAIRISANQKTLYMNTIQNSLPEIIVFAIPVIVIFVAFYIFKKQNLKQSFLKSPDCNKRLFVEITSAEISIKLPDVYEMVWKWTSLIEIRRTPKGFCFFQAPHSGFWIPLHAFESQNDIEIISEMAKHLSPKYIITNN
jgi:heme/copper-type cytochrome/quinol oxidase subunit 2